MPEEPKKKLHRGAAPKPAKKASSWRSATGAASYKPDAPRAAGKKPAGKNAAAKSAAAKNPAAKNPAAKSPAAKSPAKNAAAKSPAAKRPATTQPTARKPAAGPARPGATPRKPASRGVATGKPASGTSRSDGARSDAPRTPRRDASAERPRRSDGPPNRTSRAEAPASRMPRSASPTPYVPRSDAPSSRTPRAGAPTDRPRRTDGPATRAPRSDGPAARTSRTAGPASRAPRADGPGDRPRRPAPAGTGAPRPRADGPARRGAAAPRAGAADRPRTARAPERPAGPALPPEADPRLLPSEVRRELRSLQDVTADRVAGHLVAAGQLVDDDPVAAYEHAKAAKALAARIGAVREACGVTAYRAGDFATALTDLKAARRITGLPDHLPLLADCERALGRPDRALAVVADPDRVRLDRAQQVELAIVASGARRDLGQPEAAVLVLQGPELDSDAVEPWTVRLWYAYADALLDAGRRDDALTWFTAAAAVDEEGETDAEERLAELSRPAGA